MLRRSFRPNYKGFKNEFSDVFRNTSTDVSKTKFPPQSLYPELMMIQGLLLPSLGCRKFLSWQIIITFVIGLPTSIYGHQMRFLQDPHQQKTNQPADT
jgi:hypothetical protein